MSNVPEVGTTVTVNEDVALGGGFVLRQGLEGVTTCNEDYHTYVNFDGAGTYKLRTSDLDWIVPAGAQGEFKSEVAPTIKVYLAGPMSGIKDYNFPRFHAAAAYLRTYGYEVFNPADNDIANGFDATGLEGHEAADHGFDLRKALKQDLSWICDHADFIALMDGWEASRGVAAEVALAKAIGIKQFHFTRFAGGTPV